MEVVNIVGYAIAAALGAVARPFGDDLYKAIKKYFRNKRRVGIAQLPSD